MENWYFRERLGEKYNRSKIKNLKKRGETLKFELEV